MTKIFIIGISGSGKTYLSNILSKKHKIPAFELDDIYFTKKYSKKNSKEKCKQILNQLLKKHKNWIFEGIYTTWTKKLIIQSDQIIWLNFPKNLLTFRIIKRRFQKQKHQRESFKELINLIKYQRNYKNIWKTKKQSIYNSHLELIKGYENKLIIIKTKKELQNYLNEIK